MVSERDVESRGRSEAQSTVKAPEPSGQEVPKKKRQHYVPRLILREFSRDERTLSVFILANGRRVDGASLREQCYEDYFYGRDGRVEEGFASQEGKFRTALGDLSAEQLNALAESDLKSIKQFVHYQRQRTVGAASQLSNLQEALAKKMLSADRRLAGHLDKVRLRHSNPQMESLYHAVESYPLVLDLAVKFLVSRKKKFVVSDDPAVACNQFVEHHPILGSHPSGSTGLVAKGLQLFLPVSPSVCVALYDASTYRYGSPDRLTCGVSSRDVDLLNIHQSLNAHECLYFHPDHTTDDELRCLYAERKRRGDWRVPRFNETPMVRRPDGKLSQFVFFEVPDLRLGYAFTFAQVTDRTDYRGYSRAILPPRSEHLLDLLDDYSAFLKKKAAEKKGASAAEEAGGK